MTNDQRRNIMVNVKKVNQDNCYDKMKSSILLLKGCLVEDDPKPKVNVDEDVN